MSRSRNGAGNTSGDLAALVTLVQAAEALRRGEVVKFSPRGHSMEPRVHDRQEITLEPAHLHDVEAGDVVLVKVRGRFYVHLVRAKMHEAGGDRYQIGNNKGRVNGWVSRSSIYGRQVT